MPTLTREQLIAGILALGLTLGTVGWMVAKQNELSDAAAQGRENRLKDLDLAPPK